MVAYPSIPERTAKVESSSAATLRDLSEFAPTTVGRTADAVVEQAFDAGEGVVVGPLPRAREGLAVAATDPASPTN